jgi:acetyltransferase-like isoleucine patch superfamily enzyme
MKNDISNNIIIYPSAILGTNVLIEPFAIIGIADRFQPSASTIIGDNSFIGSRCTIYEGVTTAAHFDVSDQTTIFYDNSFGEYCRIGPKAIIKNGCRFADHIRVNAKVFMERVIVNAHVFIGPGVTFTDDRHPACPHNAQCTPHSYVESYVSIGANAVIAPGVVIGHHSQIYAGAVVTKDVAPYSVMAGNPAKKINDVRLL